MFFWACHKQTDTLFKKMFFWPQKDTVVHYWTFLRRENRDFDIFVENVFLTFEPGSWCFFDPGRTRSSTIGPSFGVKSRFWCFCKQMFFDLWPLTLTPTYIPGLETGHPARWPDPAQIDFSLGPGGPRFLSGRPARSLPLFLRKISYVYNRKGKI
jgi:hypothetical protein